MTTVTLSIETILERCLRAIREGNYSIDDCLAHYPTQKEELEPLLLLVIRLQSARTLEAPDEFRELAISHMNDLIDDHPRPNKRRAKARLAALAKTQGSSKDSSQKNVLWRSVVIGLIFVLLLFVIGGAMVVASSSALPGDILYPLKNTVEITRLAISPSGYNDATLNIKYAQYRLEEAEVFIQRQEYWEAKYSLGDYQVEAKATLEYLRDDSELSREQRIELGYLTLERFSQYQARLQVFQNLVPDTIRSTVELALDLTRQVLEQAKLCVNIP
ncbi:MAG: hypothetical protein JW908_10010 [Anaerolineales bacterium]|nr:hypothetical protein [Anaerolineales bacterium]